MHLHKSRSVRVFSISVPRMPPICLADTACSCVFKLQIIKGKIKKNKDNAIALNVLDWNLHISICPGNHFPHDLKLCHYHQKQYSLFKIFIVLHFCKYLSKFLAHQTCRSCSSSHACLLRLVTAVVVVHKIQSNCYDIAINYRQKSSICTAWYVKFEADTLYLMPSYRLQYNLGSKR